MEDPSEANNPEKRNKKSDKGGDLEEVICDASLSGSKGLEYSWSNINVYNRGNWFTGKCVPKSKQKEPKQILKNVTGCFQSGQLVALMGASGAGKSTLLNVLNLRNTEGLQVEGSMCVNAKPVNAYLLGTISAYIQQDDMFFGTLTVREHLTFHARVRMKGKLSFKDRQARVNEVMHNLNLEKCADTRIGTPGYIKGISGGEMKRLAFAAEILTDPAILFCDEPTSGLDSTMALTVVQTLRNMADQGKAVICTIHQPSSACFDTFTEIILLADGRVAYQGKKEGATQFFANFGLTCPVNYNPADYFVQQLALLRHQSVSPGGDQKKKMDHLLCDNFLDTEEFAKIQGVCKSHSSGLTLIANPVDVSAVGSHSRYQSSFLKQFLALLWRAWLTLIRDPNSLRIRLSDTFVIGLLISAIYYNQDYSAVGVRNLTGASYMIITCISFQNVFGVCNTFCRELPIFLREHVNGMYRADAYFLSKTLAEFPLYIFYPALFISITYFLIGLDPKLHKFGMALLIMILVSFVTVSFGYLISCMSGQTETALVLITPMIMPAMLFGGYFLQIDNDSYLDKYFSWCQYISWFYYSSEAMSINQWDDDDIKLTEFPYPTGKFFLKYSIKSEAHNLGRDLWALVFSALAIRITAFLLFFSRTIRCNGGGNNRETRKIQPTPKPQSLDDSMKNTEDPQPGAIT